MNTEGNTGSTIMGNEITIRGAGEADAKELLGIYAPYVTATAVTFEYTVPPLEEFRDRIARTLEKYPYLVAVSGERILGYAYASAFKGRAAYDWSVETSIYVRMDKTHEGTGKALYAELEKILKKQHIINLNACIAYPNPESIAFHERLGYKTVAHFTKCGYKCGKWYDMIWMEKMLSEHPDNPQPVIPYGTII